MFAYNYNSFVAKYQVLADCFAVSNYYKCLTAAIVCCIILKLKTETKNYSLLFYTPKNLTFGFYT